MCNCIQIKTQAFCCLQTSKPNQKREPRSPTADNEPCPPREEPVDLADSNTLILQKTFTITNPKSPKEQAPARVKQPVLGKTFTVKSPLVALTATVTDEKLSTIKTKTSETEEEEVDFPWKDCLATV